MSRSGNFWWANCDHVARIPAPVSRFDTYAAEFFILTTFKSEARSIRFAHVCAFNSFRCGERDKLGEYKTVNHYYDECMLDMYLQRIRDSVNSYDVPPSAPSGADVTASDKAAFPSCFNNHTYDGTAFRYHFQTKRGYGKG